MSARPTPAYEVLLPLAPWEPPAIVAAALASLERQSLPPRRLVLSCDGPPPPALRAVLAACPLPQLLLEGPGGEGVGPVLARGLLACESELVVRADADDLSAPSRCCRQVEWMLAEPDLAVTSAPIEEFRSEEANRTLCLRTVPCGAERVRRLAGWRNPLNHPAVILRRSRVLAVGNYRACDGFEDYDLWLRLLRSGARLDNLAEPLVRARVGPAHLARRRGWAYARREAAFYRRCAAEGLLPPARALLLVLLRCPLRVLPPALQLLVTRWISRRPPAI